MRILFAGDIHGNEDHLAWVMEQGADRSADVVFSVGDFGYWPHYPSGQDFLQYAHDLAADCDLPILWIPGNHENWDVLDSLVKRHGDTKPIPTPPKSKKYVDLTGLVQFVPRGCKFTLGDLTVLGVGGAWSVDWQRRIKGKSWWPQECITGTHVDAIPNEPVDILVTHEAPNGKAISYKDDWPISVGQRDLVSEIVRKVTPSLVVCGHHHLRTTWRDADTSAEIQVLGRDHDHYDSDGQPSDAAQAEESILLVDTIRWKRERAKAASLPTPA